MTYLRGYPIVGILLLALAVIGAEGNSAESSYTFALIPKNINNDFFSVARDGCIAQARTLEHAVGGNVTCLYVGPEEDDPVAQAAIIDAMINGTYGKIDGISVSVSDADITGEAINRAMKSGIPTITFDSDASGSLREAYIGTSNFAFGEVLGKLLNQLEPTGGKYGILAASAPNVMKRVEGVRKRLEGTKWTEVESSYKDSLDDTSHAVEQMYEFADDSSIDAIISVGGWPMFEADGWKTFVDLNRDLTLVVGDTLPVQLELMNRGYVDGLVGQLPFQMGAMSVDVLLKLVQGGQVEDQIYGTALLEVLKFPLVLPPNYVNENHLGNLAITSYVLFALVAIVSLGLMGWTYLKRKTRVIKASQPFFLQMVIVGVLIFASAMLPLTFDSEQYSQRQLDAACMATPWCMVIGFSTIFSALFAKTWRINKIFHNPNAFRRIKITEKDVLKPYFVILGLNVITLSCWTAIAPLTYQRFDSPGTDDWNRVIATFGVCTGESMDRSAKSFVPFLIILVAINMGLLVIANVQAYQARSIQTEYSESKYIAIINASILEACLLGVPCMFLLWDIPRAYYTVLVMITFVICAAVLLFLFWPKIYHTMIWAEEKQAKERKKAAQRASVIRSAGGEDGLKIAVRPKPAFNSTMRPANDQHAVDSILTSTNGHQGKEESNKLTPDGRPTLSCVDDEVGLMYVSTPKVNIRSSSLDEKSEGEGASSQPPSKEDGSLKEVESSNGFKDDEDESEMTLEEAMAEIKRLRLKMLENAVTESDDIHKAS